MAVDLAGRHGRDLPARCLLEGGLQVGIPLVDVEGASEGLLGAQAGVFEARKS